jgi:octaprenyl-diphosphate synthase
MLARTPRRTPVLPTDKAVPSAAALQDILALVRPELVRMNTELVGDLRPESASLSPLLAHVGDYRGKQLRPALVFLTAKMFRGVEDTHFTCAKVVELIHTATLVHDDILDGAAVRRSEKTVNELHGNEVPVLLGDYLYSLAFHMAVSLDDPVCARQFSSAVRLVCQGEITQCLHRGDLDWDEDRYFRVISEKTASLYAAACWVGGHYAGAQKAQLQALWTFGESLGTAFQIIDDCLDLTGEETVVGKSLGTDLKLGKLTLPMIYLLSNSGNRRAQLVEMLTDPGSTRSFRELQQEFDVDACVSYALGQGQKFVERGLDALSSLPAGSARDAVAGLAEYVLERQY